MSAATKKRVPAWVAAAAAAGQLAPWRRPELTGFGRLPMRPRLPAYRSADAALAAEPFASGAAVDLNGPRPFAHFATPQAALDALAAGPDSIGWSDARVPGNWVRQGWDAPHYTNVRMPFAELPPAPPADNPTGLYRFVVATPRLAADERLVFHLGATESVAVVFCNGALVGVAKDSRLESEFDLRAFVTDAELDIVVLVTRYGDTSFLEDQDQWWMAGIHRDCFLRIDPLPGIRELALSADFDPARRVGNLDLELVLDPAADAVAAPLTAGPADTPRPVTVSIRLLDGPTPLDDGTATASLRAVPASQGMQTEDPTGGDRARLSLERLEVEPWSAELPRLYTLLIELAAPGRAGVFYCRQIGFRRVEARDDALWVNGVAVRIHGANRHEHDQHHGKAITREGMLQDIRLMKRYGFNAVRCSHYPNHHDWYDLCDRHGLYVIDEANVEAHHFYNEITRDPRYTAAIGERVRRMVARDRCHPSIIIWSMGNESGYAAVHDALAAWIKSTDPTRPVLYEPAVRGAWGQGAFDFTRGSGATDIIAPMYAHPDQIEAWADGPGDGRPLILCEYSHAMGNSNGGLEDYMRLFGNARGVQGGFVWDWVDQGLVETLPDGRTTWVYGGFYGDAPTDRDFCINGLVWPDRTPHPALAEFAFFHSRVALDLDLSAAGVTIGVTNRFDFAVLPALTIDWRLEVVAAERTWSRCGNLSTTALGAPGARRHALVPTDHLGAVIAAAAVPEAVELVLTAEVRLGEDCAIGSRSDVVGWAQRFVTPDGLLAAAPGAHARVALQTLRAAFGRSESDRGPVRSVTAAPGATDATLVLELQDERTPVLVAPGIRAPLALQLFRAPTENDLIRSMPDQEDKPGMRWLRLGLDRIESSWSGDAHDGGLIGRHGADGVALARSHTVAERRGVALALRVRVELTPAVDDPARVGLRLTLPAAWERLTWYGRGPGENYPDRANGSQLGVWSATVTDRYVPYIVPQEHGAHTDTRWVRLSDGRYTLSVAAPGSGMTVSALHTAAEALAKLEYRHQVQPADATYLSLDHFHRGIGTLACGPDCAPRYRARGNVFEWEWIVHVRGG